jgi:hypothetical protein
MKHCQECNLDFPDSYRFCGSCGGALRQSLSCQGCGELVESKWTFCTNCGKGLLPEITNSQAPPSEAREFRDIPAASPIPAIAALQTMPAPVPGQRMGNGAPQEWYATPDLFEDADETTAASSLPRELIPRTTIAVPITPAHRESGNGKAPPTLTMLSAYGESGTNASPEWQRHHLLLVGLLLLVFFGALGFGGWYWWTHRASVAQSPPQAASTNAPAVADSSSPASAASSATTSSTRTNTGGGAEEEWKRLREKRVGAKPSETGEIIAAFEAAERKYPNDYRFPYERAKLSIKGITSHHEAFGALALAGEKAIDNAKAQEMLDSLMADKDGDFYKPSRGHREWAVLVQALRNKDKRGLGELHH